MKVFKKVLLILLAVVSIACVVAVAACTHSSDDETWYTVIFRQTNGVSYKSDFKSGYEAKEGSVITFSLKLSKEAEGEPVVHEAHASGGENILTPDEKGKYSFTVTDDTTIRVTGVVAPGDDYNRLIFDTSSGVTFVTEPSDLASGMNVAVGYLVKFKIVIGFDYDGSPVVYANDTVLSPDADGFYSFEMLKPTTVRVEGLTKLIKVNFDNAGGLVRYLKGTSGTDLFDPNEDNIYSEGSNIVFRLKVSSYYLQTGYEVMVGSLVVTPNSSGVYTATVTSTSSNLAVSVTGLEQDVSFTEREDGSGTPNDPFRLRKPIDLYQMAGIINSSWYEGWYNASYYRLENDIDLDGEQLYTIGNASNGYAYFAGNFDGNGKKITNFTMSNVEEVVVVGEDADQAIQTNYLSYVGMFGYVMPRSQQAPSIYNLTLDNFVVNVQGNLFDAETVVGGIVGMGYGVSVTGCAVTNGSFRINANDDYATYVGGIVGQQVSAYSAEAGIAVNASIISSYTSNVKIQILRGFGYAAGGISGFVAVGTERVSSYILNSYVKGGTIEGAINAGGIAGYLSISAAIMNSYSDTEVSAVARTVPDSQYNPAIFYANAGGIAGYAAYDSVIYNSFSMSYTYASAAGGNSYRKVGGIVADKDTGDKLTVSNAKEPVIYGCQTKTGSLDENFIRNTMHWDSEDWLFENGVPVINRDNETKQFKITLIRGENGGEKTAKDEVNVNIGANGSDYGYYPMADWYADGRISEFVYGEAGYGSYGYYFDEELQYRVPFGFVPTGTMTLYIGFANYGAVAGRYYLGNSVDDTEYIELDDGGHFYYRHGALTHNSTYIYDGETIHLLYTVLGEMLDGSYFVPRDYSQYEEAGITGIDKNADHYKDYYRGEYLTYGAKVDIERGTISITGGYIGGILIYTVDGEYVYGDTGEYFYLLDEGSALVGRKAVENFVYGSYYDGDTVYTFNGNGTGTKDDGGVISEFTYTVVGETSEDRTLNIIEEGVNGKVDGDGYVTEINSKTVNAYDGFNGKWESAATSSEWYSFDGKGNYKGSSSSGTYTLSNNKKTLNASGFTATIDENGFLAITKSNVTTTYYREGSFVGDWYFNHQSVLITLSLNGINQEGVGTAVATYTGGEEYALTYEAQVSGDSTVLRIYREESQYAVLSYDSAAILLKGTIDGLSGGWLTLYDDFKGTWISTDSALPTVTFDGNGYYSLNGDVQHGMLGVTGKVTIGGSRVTYKVDHATNTAKFTYASTEYTLKYENGKISGTSPRTINLEHRDIWYGNDLIDDDNIVYSFDGRGNLGAQAGTIRATRARTDTAESVDKTYKYSISGDTINVTDGSGKNGTITLNDGGRTYVLKINGESDVELTLSTPFTGDWIVGNMPGELHVSKVYADNTASGSFYNEPVEFTYHPDGKYLTFTYDGEDMYVNSIQGSELSVGTDNSVSGANNAICIPLSLKDDWYGHEFKELDANGNEVQNGKILVFNGLSASNFGSGLAILYHLDGSGNQVIDYSYIYTINPLGMPELIYDYWAYVFAEYNLKSGESLPASSLGMYKGDDGKTYAVLYPNSLLYGLEVSDLANPTQVWYTFDGIGGVTRHNADGSNTKFTYVLLKTEENYVSTLEFTDEAGNVYTATLDMSNTSNSSSWRLSLTAKS